MNFQSSSTTDLAAKWGVVESVRHMVEGSLWKLARGEELLHGAGDSLRDSAAASTSSADVAWDDSDSLALASGQVAPRSEGREVCERPGGEARAIAMRKEALLRAKGSGFLNDIVNDDHYPPAATIAAYEK